MAMIGNKEEEKTDCKYYFYFGQEDSKNFLNIFMEMFSKDLKLRLLEVEKDFKVQRIMS